MDLANVRFGPLTHSNPLGELCRLCHALDNYINKFYQRLTWCDELFEPQQIVIFIVGLGEPLKTDVELNAPITLEDAAALAHAYIQRRTVAIALPAPSSHHSSECYVVAPAATPSPPQHQASPATPGAPVKSPPFGSPRHDKALSRRDGSTP
jgi:hypothetical protein